MAGLSVLAFMLLTTGAVIHAQQAATIRRVGYLSAYGAPC